MHLAYKVNAYISGRRPDTICDACIAKSLDILHQQANRVTMALETTSDFDREYGICLDCRKEQSAAQWKMARAATGLGVRELAEQAGVSPNTVARLERGEDLKSGTLDAIRTALEAAGVELIPENGGGAWVRLRKA